MWCPQCRLAEKLDSFIALPHGIATSVTSAAHSNVQVTVMQSAHVESTPLLKGVSIVYSEGCLAAISIDAATVQAS